MRIRLVAGATLALITMSMITGCIPGADPSPKPTPSVDTQEPTETPTPTPTPSADPVASGDGAVQACTIIAEKNWVEPGVEDVLKEAAGLANDAAAADPQWQPLADSLSMLAVAYILREANPEPFNAALPPAAEQCDAVGVSIVAG